MNDVIPQQARAGIGKPTLLVPPGRREPAREFAQGNGERQGVAFPLQPARETLPEAQRQGVGQVIDEGTLAGTRFSGQHQAAVENGRLQRGKRPGLLVSPLAGLRRTHCRQPIQCPLGRSLQALSDGCRRRAVASVEADVDLRQA